jgi:hypothetical protein
MLEFTIVCVCLLIGTRLTSRYLSAGITRGSVPRWLARMLCDWHRRKAKRLSKDAEKQRNELERLMERAEHHEHRAKHWDLVANRRRR